MPASSAVGRKGRQSALGWIGPWSCLNCCCSTWRDYGLGPPSTELRAPAPCPLVGRFCRAVVLLLGPASATRQGSPRVPDLWKETVIAEQGELLGWSRGGLCAEALAYFSGDNKQSLLNNQLIMEWSWRSWPSATPGFIYWGFDFLLLMPRCVMQLLILQLLVLAAELLSPCVHSAV